MSSRQSGWVRGSQHGHTWSRLEANGGPFSIETRGSDTVPRSATRFSNRQHTHWGYSVDRRFYTHIVFVYVYDENGKISLEYGYKTQPERRKRKKNP